MITRTVFTNLIRAMEGIHDLDEVFETLLGRNPDNVPDSIIGRLQSVISAVMDILGTEEADELMEIAGSDMDLDKKVDVLMQLYPGKVADSPVTDTD